MLWVKTSLAQLETKGKEFWGTSTLGSGWGNAALFISSEQAANVTVHVFASSKTYNLTIAKNSLVSLNLTRADVMCSEDQLMETKGFKITSNVDVSAYLLLPSPATSDATILFPSHAIPGNSEYLLLTYGEEFPVGNRVAILSHEDNNLVQITLKNNSLGNSTDSVIIVTLNKGQCYQVKQITGYQISGGTVNVLSKGKKVSVFCGNVITTVGRDQAADMLLEQVPPKNTLGRHFVITPFLDHTKGFIFEVAASVDNTVIRQDGVVVAVLEEGEVYMLDIDSERAVCIDATNPVLVSQMMKSSAANGKKYGDPAFFYVNPLEQSIKSALIATPNSSQFPEHYLSVILSKAGRDSFYLDDLLVSRTKLTTSQCGNYFWYTDSITPGTHSLKNKYGFLSILYGLGPDDSYLYSAGSGLQNLKVEILHRDSFFCDRHREFTFEASDSTSDYYAWIWDDGSPPIYGLKAVHRFYDLKRQHLVKLAYSNTSGQIDTTYQYLTFSDTGRINLIEKDQIATCSDSTFEISIDTIINANYLWSTGDTSAKITISSGGIYSVIATYSITGCQTFDTVNINFLESVEANFKTDTVCLNEANTIISTSKSDSNITNYRWIVDGLPVYGLDTVTTTMSSSGRFEVQLIVSTANGCTDTATKSKSLVVLDIPQADFTYQLFPQPNSLTVNFFDQSSNDVVYRDWSFPDRVSDSIVFPIVTFTQKGPLVIVLYVENISGCWDTAIRIIDYRPDFSILVPSAFTPSNDGLNDGFGPLIFDQSNNYSMLIFNRWGEQIFESNSLSEKWNGTYQGVDCPQGAYLYLISYTNDNNYRQMAKGTVTLIR
ncbi:MAG: hypothetical protein COA58_03920 [Bacteroidetes bacterium]|nr:MAG: hypothetical protein COA58_03920 [Bacteroidota bacterium]